MINVYLAVYLLLLHYWADFVLQDSRVAQGKSKNNFILLEHVTIYSAALFWGLAVFIYYYSIFGLFTFVLLNGVIHFAVDYFTSRLNSKLYQREDKTHFFFSLGFDQFLHGATLILTSQLL